jgi:cell division control protein 12
MGPIIDFVDDQCEAYMRQEQQSERAEKTDLRVHACLFFIRPTGHTYGSALPSLQKLTPP